MAPRILIFSIVLGAEYSFYLKSIATYAPAFLGYNNSALARVRALGAMRAPKIIKASEMESLVFGIYLL